MRAGALHAVRRRPAALGRYGVGRAGLNSRLPCSRLPGEMQFWLPCNSRPMAAPQPAPYSTLHRCAGTPLPSRARLHRRLLLRLSAAAAGAARGALAGGALCRRHWRGGGEGRRLECTARAGCLWLRCISGCHFCIRLASPLQVAMAVNFFRAGVPAKEVALGALGRNPQHSSQACAAAACALPLTRCPLCRRARAM